MLDDEITTSPPEPPSDTAPADSAPPVRRTRRRAASRPAGPPLADAPASDEATAPAVTAEASASEQAAASTDKPARKTTRRSTKKAAKKAESPAVEALADIAPAEATTTSDSAPPAAIDPMPVVADAPAEEVRPRRRRTTKKSAPSVEPAPTDQPAATAPPGDDTLPAVDEVTTAVVSEGPVSPFSAAATAAAPESSAPASEAPDAAAAPAAAPPVVLFQAPDPVEAPKRRRSTRAAAAPTPVETDSAPASDGAAAAETSSDDPAPASGVKPSGDGDGDDDSTTGRRRRSRGGRNRRKPSADADAGPDKSVPADASADTRQADPDEETKGGDETVSPAQVAARASGPDEPIDTDESSGSSRRRRRRRRNSDDGDGGNDDPDNTVVRVRAPRPKKESVSNVEGSTRLEAKKQRRREGREAGRRRPPILSESEFLARRESVDRVMAIRQRGETTQIAVLEDSVLVEHYVALESQNSLIGNVYVGRVQNVLPSMEAAFIDIGKGRNAVLYAGEVNWSLMGGGNQARRIENALKPGQPVLVQVSKDPVGHKGARLTSMISLPGRYLVYVPGGGTSGISRKLPDTERARLKALLKKSVPDEAGVIVRTAAEGASEEELTRDVNRLTARWEDIDAKSKNGQAPQLLYAEPDTTLKVVRDLFTEDFSRLVISGDDAWDMVEGYVQHVAPDLVDRLERYEGEGDLFASFRIDEQIAKALERKVWLPSGGSLVIDRTEAMTVVDVNTGKFTGSGGNLEETVTKNNLEAAEEIVRQMRLRDIGGIIVVDFIDMVLEGNRDLVLRRLVECLGRDRTRHQVAEVTSLGLVQMTRKRISTGLLEAFSHNCEVCGGRGVVINHDPIEPNQADSSGASDAGAQRGGGSRSEGRKQSDDGARGGSKRSSNRRRGQKSDSEQQPAREDAKPTADEGGAGQQTAVTSTEPISTEGPSSQAPESTVTASTAQDSTVSDSSASDSSAAGVPSTDSPSGGSPTGGSPADESTSDEAAAVEPTLRELLSTDATPTASQPQVPAPTPDSTSSEPAGAVTLPTQQTTPSEPTPEAQAAPAAATPPRRRRRSATRPAGQPTPVRDHAGPSSAQPGEDQASAADPASAGNS